MGVTTNFLIIFKAHSILQNPHLAQTSGPRTCDRQVLSLEKKLSAITLPSRHSDSSGLSLYAKISSFLRHHQRSFFFFFVLDSD